MVLRDASASKNLRDSRSRRSSQILSLQSCRMQASENVGQSWKWNLKSSCHQLDFILMTFIDSHSRGLLSGKLKFKSWLQHASRQFRSKWQKDENKGKQREIGIQKLIAPPLLHWFAGRQFRSNSFSEDELSNFFHASKPTWLVFPIINFLIRKRSREVLPCQLYV